MQHLPSNTDCAQILSHVRYEIEQCFIIRAHHQGDWHLEESVFLAILIHARILLTFFESNDRRKDDVLCSDLGFPSKPVSISPEARLRFNKDMVHLTYSRLRHTSETKPWPVVEILLPLLERAIEFMTHVVSHPPAGADLKELDEWSALLKLLLTAKSNAR
jgi:hypothetical protein